MKQQANGGRLLRLLPLLLMLALATASCGKSNAGGGSSGGNSGSSNSGSSVSDTISMDPTNFTQHSITVKANQPVHFSDTVDGGGLHILCVGTGSGGTNTCQQSGNAPAGLLGEGTTINPGETKDFTFTTPGKYHVICTIHPGMYIDITAQ